MTLSSEDRFAIQDLCASYCHAIDFGESDAWAATFTENGEFLVPGRDPVTGSEGLAAFAQSVFNRGGKTRHWTSNLVAEPAVGGAIARSYFSVVATGGGTEPATMTATGRYFDTLVKTAEGWRFARREIAFDA